VLLRPNIGYGAPMMSNRMNYTDYLLSAYRLIRNQTRNTWRINLTHQCGLAQFAFEFRWLLVQNMAHLGAVALNFPAPGFLKPFRSRAVGLDLGHNTVTSYSTALLFSSSSFIGVGGCCFRRYIDIFGRLDRLDRLDRR